MMQLQRERLTPTLQILETIEAGRNSYALTFLLFHLTGRQNRKGLKMVSNPVWGFQKKWNKSPHLSTFADIFKTVSILHANAT